MKYRIFCLVAALCLLVGLLSACGDEPDPASPILAERGQVERAPLGEHRPAAKAEAVLSALNTAGRRDSARWEPEEDWEAGSGTRLALSGDAAGDTVAVAGDRIYMLDRYGLIILTARGQASELLSYTQVEREGADWSERLYVTEDRAAVLYTVTDYGADEAGVWYDASEAHLTIFDASDPRAPKRLTELAVEGDLVDAVLLDGTLCLVTEKTWLRLPEEGEAEAVLPKLRENGKTLSLHPGDVYLSPTPEKAALTVAAAIRLEDGRFADALAFTDGTEAVLGAGDCLCLSRTRWDETASEPYREAPYTVVDYTAAAKTEIKRLRLKNGLFTLEGGCLLDGALTDPAALDLLNGSLRAATQVDSRDYAAYTDENHGWTNFEGKRHVRSDQIVLLNGDLEVTGSLVRVGGEAGLTACRFLGDTAWVTAGEEGVLGLADLSDPAAPAMGGALSAGGDTLLLRAFGPDLVLALRAPASGGDWLMMVYDAADPAAPKLLDSVKLDEAPAGDLSARGALLADPETGFIGYPAQGDEDVEYRLVRWTGSRLREEGALDLEYVPANARGLLIEGLLYVCSPGAVYVVDPEGQDVLATVSNTVG